MAFQRVKLDKDSAAMLLKLQRAFEAVDKLIKSLPIGSDRFNATSKLEESALWAEKVVTVHQVQKNEAALKAALKPVTPSEKEISK